MLKKILLNIVYIFMWLAGLSGVFDSIYPSERGWWRRSLIVKIFALLLSFFGCVWVLLGAMDIVTLSNPAFGFFTFSVGALTLLIGLSLLGYLGSFWSALNSKFIALGGSLTKSFILSSIANKAIHGHHFLEAMYADDYYPVYFTPVPLTFIAARTGWDYSFYAERGRLAAEPLGRVSQTN